MTTQKTLFNLFVFAIPIFLFGQDGRVVINSSDKEQTIAMNRFQEMVPSSFTAKDVMKDAGSN
jgi:hypothetical protein